MKGICYLFLFGVFFGCKSNQKDLIIANKTYKVEPAEYSLSNVADELSFFYTYTDVLRYPAALESNERLVVQHMKTETSYEVAVTDKRFNIEYQMFSIPKDQITFNTSHIFFWKECQLDTKNSIKEFCDRYGYSIDYNPDHYNYTTFFKDKGKYLIVGKFLLDEDGNLSVLKLTAYQKL